MKTVFIGGASSDIGLAVCKRYLADGNYKLITHYRTLRPELDELIMANRDRITPFKLDFSETENLENILIEKAKLVQSTDIFINLAADLVPTSFETVKAHEVLAVLSANLIPGLMLMQAMGPSMTKRGWGRIVHASSVGVKFGGGQNSFAYSLSKHALEFMPREVRNWAQHGVFTNILRIGVTDTRSMSEKKLVERVQLIPAKRAATVDEIARSIIWFGSESNGFITNEIIDVAGGE